MPQPVRFSPVASSLGWARKSATGAAFAVPTEGVATVGQAGEPQDHGRQGKKRGQCEAESLLAALAAMQLGMLAGTPDSALARLAELAEAKIYGAETGIMSVLEALQTRAKVELARHARAKLNDS